MKNLTESRNSLSCKFLSDSKNVLKISIPQVKKNYFNYTVKPILPAGARKSPLNSVHPNLTCCRGMFPSL